MDRGWQANEWLCGGATIYIALQRRFGEVTGAPPPHIGAYRRWVSMHSGVERLFWPINYCGEL